MIINWFPGHMATSQRLIKQYLPVCDAIVYVLDSRSPYACLNPDLNRLCGNKPIVYVLNKADISPVSQISGWVDKLTSENSTAIPLIGTDKKSASKVVAAIIKSCQKKIEKYKARSLNADLRAMVIGVPNTGKSTIINSLAPRAKLVTGNRAGVTRGVSWVRAGKNLEVLDTPGTLYPKLNDQRKALHLAFIGSIRDEVLDKTELAKELAKELNSIDENILISRYGQEGDYINSPLQTVAFRRGLLLKGGEPDIDHAAIALIDDFRKCRLGKLCLDDPKNC